MIVDSTLSERIMDNNKSVKHPSLCETSLVKLRKGRLKTAESPGRGGPQDERDASLISLHSGISSEGNVVHSQEAYRVCHTSLSLWSIRNNIH